MLSEFDIQYKLKTTIKGQAHANFVVKFTIVGAYYSIKKRKMLEVGPFISIWTLYID